MIYCTCKRKAGGLTTENKKEKCMTARQMAAAETKKKLIEAGRKIIFEKGLTGTSVEEITAAAGVSKGTFYTYFARKEDIITELRYGAFGDILEEAKMLPGNFEAKLRHYMTRFSAYIEKDGAKMAQDWVRSVVNPDLVRGTPSEGKLLYDLTCIRKLFEYGVKNNLLKADTPAEYLAHTLMDVLYGQMLCWAMSEGTYSLKARTEEFCGTALPAMLRPYVL